MVSHFPVEVCEIILQFLTFRSVLTIRTISKNWYMASQLTELHIELFSKPLQIRSMINHLNDLNITRLTLIECGITPEDVRLIASSTHMNNLTTMDLTDNTLICDEGMSYIFNNNSQLYHLVDLTLYNCRIGCRGIESMINSSISQHLTSLDLGYNISISDLEVTSLCKVGFQSLERLVLCNNSVGDDGCKAIANASSMCRLRELRLGGNPIRIGISHLASSCHMKHLETLVLNYTSGFELVNVLLNNPQFVKLSTLDLYHCLLDSQGAKLLSQFHLLLTYLDISDNYIGIEGWKDIVTSPHMNQLRTLKNQFGNIDCAAISLLVSCPFMSQLTHLDLTNNILGDDGAKMIACSSVMHNIRKLELTDNGITGIGVAFIQNSVHLTQLIDLDIT